MSLRFLTHVEAAGSVVKSAMARGPAGSAGGCGAGVGGAGSGCGDGSGVGVAVRDAVGAGVGVELPPQVPDGFVEMISVPSCPAPWRPQATEKSCPPPPATGLRYCLAATAAGEILVGAGHAPDSDGAIVAWTSSMPPLVPLCSVPATRISPAALVAAVALPNGSGRWNAVGPSQVVPDSRETTMSSWKFVSVGRRVHTATAPCGWRTSACRLRRSNDGGGFGSV